MQCGFCFLSHSPYFHQIDILHAVPWTSLLLLLFLNRSAWKHLFMILFHCKSDYSYSKDYLLLWDVCIFLIRKSYHARYVRKQLLHTLQHFCAFLLPLLRNSLPRKWSIHHMGLAWVCPMLHMPPCAFRTETLQGRKNHFSNLHASPL